MRPLDMELALDGQGAYPGARDARATARYVARWILSVSGVATMLIAFYLLFSTEDNRISHIDSAISLSVLTAHFFGIARLKRKLEERQMELESVTRVAV